MNTIKTYQEFKKNGNTKFIRYMKSRNVSYELHQV